jgi:hypothetical protein
LLLLLLLLLLAARCCTAAASLAPVSVALVAARPANSKRW